VILSATIMGLGMHLAAWRAREGDAVDYVDPELYREIARTAEAGKLHCVFLADTLTNAEEGTDRPALGAMDPAVVLAIMAGVTERVGLVGTASTTFNTPFDLARRFATLDHLSGGRAGWNAVTTFVPAVAENFGGRALPERDERYAHAREFIDVVLKLWESWGAGALVGDKGRGVFADPGLVRPIDHDGEHFTVRGPLTMPRTPQGHPALFQAGSSDAGRDLAARYADVVFTAQNVLDAARDFRTDVRRRTAATRTRSRSCPGCSRSWVTPRRRRGRASSSSTTLPAPAPSWPSSRAVSACRWRSSCSTRRCRWTACLPMRSSPARWASAAPPCASRSRRS
jgi:FMN-dependent oxidoreductase (nitrilotriacetate monooxygenase family)